MAEGNNVTHSKTMTESEINYCTEGNLCYLTTAVGASANADGGNAQLPGQSCSDGRRHALHHDPEATSLLQRLEYTTGHTIKDTRTLRC